MFRYQAELKDTILIQIASLINRSLQQPQPRFQTTKFTKTNHCTFAEPYRYLIEHSIVLLWRKL